MDIARSYTLKIWITTLLVSPILATLELLTDATNLKDVAKILMLLLGLPFVALMLGILTMISAGVFYIATGFLLTKSFKVVHLKLVLSVFAIFIVLVNGFFFNDSKVNKELFIQLTPYWLTFIFGIWLYKIPRTSTGEHVFY